jgi:hypothetical protein
MTLDDKARFLDACPHLLDDVQAIDKALGREPCLDWPATWDRDRGATEEAREPLEGDRAEALSFGVHAARREGRAQCRRW